MRAHEYLLGAKDRHSALPADLLTDATSFIPPAVAARAARTTMDILGRTRPPLNLVISNVPGPREPLYCAGAQLQANFPVSVVIDGVGLNMTVMSYRDHVDFGIITDRDQVDDAWALMDGTAAALDELETAVCGKRPALEGRIRGRRPDVRGPWMQDGAPEGDVAGHPLRRVPPAPRDACRRVRSWSRRLHRVIEGFRVLRTK